MTITKRSNGELRRLRIHAGMSTKEMAKELGRSQSGVRFIELYYTEETPSYKLYLQAYRGIVAKRKSSKK